MITIGFTASAFVYYQMVINVSNMVGNTFLNLFLLGLVEGPGNVLGKKNDNILEVKISRHRSGEQSGSKMDPQQSPWTQCSPVWSCYGYGSLPGLI